MQRQLEQIIVAATLAFLLGCHAGLSKLLPLIPALILAAFFLLLLAWGCRQKAGVKLLAAAGIGLCFCCGAASGSGAMRQPQLPLQTFTGQEVRAFRQSGSWQCQSNAAGEPVWCLPVIRCSKRCRQTVRNWQLFTR